MHVAAAAAAAASAPSDRPVAAATAAFIVAVIYCTYHRSLRLGSAAVLPTGPPAAPLARSPKQLSQMSSSQSVGRSLGQPKSLVEEPI